MRIQYGEFYGTKGTTAVTMFWGDMHYYDFRADKVINSREDLIDVVDRFKQDKTQFDVVDFNCGWNLTRAKRKYSVPVKKLVSFIKIVYSISGESYEVFTQERFGVISKVLEYADMVAEYKQITHYCIVDDETDIVLGIGEFYGEVEMLWTLED